MKMIRDQRRSTRKGFVPSSIFQRFKFLDFVPETKELTEYRYQHGTVQSIFNRNSFPTDSKPIGYINVGDKWMLVTFDNGDIFWMLVPDANVKRQRMWVPKTAETVTKISKLSPKHFVSNIDVAKPIDSMILSLIRYREKIKNGGNWIERGLRLKIESVAP